MAEWQPIETLPEKTEVLLLWVYPGAEGATSQIRIGSILYKPYGGEKPTIRLVLDIGDASAMFFMKREDAPDYWMPLPEPPK